MHKIRTTAVGVAACVLIACMIVGCGGAVSTTLPPPSKDDLWAWYRMAISDAQEADTAEVSTHLASLHPMDPDVDRRLRVRAPGDTVREVRVVTWRGTSPLPGADTRLQAGDPVALTEVVWVTLAPRMRQFCQSIDRTGDALDRRLRQRLGLPPDFPATRMVELWVSVSDLARPCANPSTTSRTCSPEAPHPASLVSIDRRYRTWFDTVAATSYGPDGYPWTRLGYTYDWHPETSEVGMTEFIIWTPASAIVHRSMATDAYCALEGEAVGKEKRERGTVGKATVDKATVGHRSATP